jgi:hypothetical protein
VVQEKGLYDYNVNNVVEKNVIDVRSRGGSLVFNISYNNGNLDA